MEDVYLLIGCSGQVAVPRAVSDQTNVMHPNIFSHDFTIRTSLFEPLFIVLNR
jgi:hypothetical protein